MMRRNYFSVLGTLGFAGSVLVGQSATSRVAAQSVTTNWSGPYVGFSVGVGGGHSSQQDFYRPPATPTPTPPAPVVVTPAAPAPVVATPAPTPPVVTPPVTTPPSENGLGDGSYGLFGAMGGGIAGFNYQFGRYVVGLEGGIYGSTINGSSNTCGGGIVAAHTCGTRIDAEADVRGRLGYTVGQFLPYVTGGLAVQDIHAYDSFFGSGGSGWKPGFVVGGGLEYKLTQRLSLRLEYLHTEIGSKNLYSIVPGVPEYVSARTDSVRVGVSFSLGTPDALFTAR